MASKEALEIQNQNLEAQRKLMADHIENLLERDQNALALQVKLNKLDHDSTENLNDKIAENNRLRNDLAVAQRMRLQGTSCPASGSHDSNTSSASSMGNAESVLLSPETRQAVFDLRNELIRDGEQIEYLQRYIRTLIDHIEEINKKKPP